jgi:polysaccharide chain length determinant protein (PEP-CTERM system associated)
MAHDHQTGANAKASGSGAKRVGDIWRRRKWLGITVFAATLAISLGVVYSLPAMYRARATVLVDREQVPEAFVRSAVSGEVETRLQRISQEVLSRERLAGLIERFDLYPTLPRPATNEGAIEQMRRDIALEPRVVDQGGRVATVGFGLTYRGTDPQTVADVTNALAGLYVERNSTIRERQASGTASFLKAQLTEMKEKLAEQERRIGQAPMPMEAEVAGMERLSMRLRVNSDRQLRAMDRRERLIREAEAPVPGETTTPTTPVETPASRLAKLKLELAELRTKYTDKYPDVVRVKGEIAALEQTVASAPPAAAAAPAPRAQKDPVAEVDAELRMLRDEERSIQRQIASFESRADGAPKRQQEFERQARDYATTKEFYQSLLKRYEDAQIAESMEHGQKSEQFRILDAAVPPKEVLAPNRMRLGALAVALAVGLAALAVMLRERLDSSFHTVDDLREWSRVPLIAGIPPLVTESDVARGRRRFGLLTASFVVALAMAVGATYLVAHQNEQLTRLLSGG